ncbi:CHAT domain-containing protein [Pleurocapsa sp. FMAR1]|uniref:CHAT domain-containing protein n=1 Tax=Pleurocapsa sp. FMAR1 TaxID=3040204 RepID=UPI0029C6F02A|nr:CHAT domain-containing protein [Pleurocapsa sp. FMAR1]
MARRSFHFWSTLFTIALAISLALGQVSPIKAQVLDRDLVKQGVTAYQQGKYQIAIASWQQALSSYQATKDNPNTAIVLENLARVYQQIGQTEQAIAFWSQAVNEYQKRGNKQQLGRSLTELAQAYTSMGQHRQAIALLCGENQCSENSAIAIAQEIKDSLGEVAAQGSLGEAYRLRGDYAKAVDYLKASLKIAQATDNQILQMSALNSLGNTYSSLAQVSYRQAESAASRGDIYGSRGVENAPDSPVMKLRADGKQQDKIALDYFQTSLDLATQQQNSLEQVRSLISSLPLYYRLSDSTAAAKSKQQALNLISTLPPESTTVYATIDLARLLQPEKVSFTSCYGADILPKAQALLQQGVDIAQQLQDSRATSFALGELGHTYECSQDYQQALKLTEKARLTAEKERDSLYLWEWQTGRILLAQDKPEAAIAAYETAIATLESIRDNILTANRDVQFDFRDTVEPIYRGLIAQRLNTADNVLVVEPSQTQQIKNVSSILTTVDSLRLAELQNYFGNDCAINDVATINKVDLLDPNPHTAYFSTIILDDRTAVIVSFPGRKTKIVWHGNKGKTAITQEINQFRRGLENFYTQFDVTLGQNIYSWLIQPFAADLNQEQITTLVFIQDGLLRSVPMAALHDGKQFLIEKYAIATTPSLNLTSSATLNRKDLKALALGLSQASKIDNESFPPLPNVKQEISEVESFFAESKGLLNANFTPERVQQELAQTSYPIIHIATHGQFSSEPKDTFLVTGNNEKLTIPELDRIIRSTATKNELVNLITLTACQTAVGDERAALGLAGVAIQAGASSALASLWSISDEITPIVVKDFYLGLQDENLNKAQALQKAQLALIKKDISPAFWSPFILIGNWL